MDNFKKLPFNFKDISIKNVKASDIKGINPMESITEEMNTSHKKIIEMAHSAAEEKKRRHNELVGALKESGENKSNVTNYNIGGDSSVFQIQQHTINSTQSLNNEQKFNYEKTLDVLKEIKDYFNTPQFSTTFGNDSDKFKQLVESTIIEVERKEEPTLIKKSLGILKEIAVKAGTSIISTGIVGLLTGLLS